MSVLPRKTNLQSGKDGTTKIKGLTNTRMLKTESLQTVNEKGVSKNLEI